VLVPSEEAAPTRPGQLEFSQQQRREAGEADLPCAVMPIGARRLSRG
jgi:hypothetical protein